VRLLVDGAGPAVVAEPGLTRCVISGVELSASGTALEILPGSELSLAAATVSGAIAMSGGALDGSGLTVTGGLRLLAGARLTVDEGRLGGAVRSEHAEISLSRCRIAAPAGMPALHVTGGRLALDGVSIVAAGDGAVLVGCDDARLTDVAIDAGGTALQVGAGTLSGIDGLDLTGAVGLRWQGPRLDAWTWKRLRIVAASPVEGLTGLDIGGPGARPGRLPAR
jgi:hypothetical protein